MNIHSRAKIHSTAVIEGDVTIGEGTEVGAFCYIKGPALIGKNNKIYPNCTIGTEGEHRELPSQGKILIGDNNIIRELAVVQRGTGDRDTQIKNNCFIMAHVHIGHDVLICDNVTTAPNASLGGHMVALEGATIGMGASIHQNSTIGAYTMIGMGAAVTKDVPPFALCMGNPAVASRINTYQINKLGLESHEVSFDKSLTIFSYTSNSWKYLDEFEKFSKRKMITPYRRL